MTKLTLRGWVDLSVTYSRTRTNLGGWASSYPWAIIQNLSSVLRFEVLGSRAKILAAPLLQGSYKV